MSSLTSAKRIIRLTCAMAPALLCVALPVGQAQTASLEFTGTFTNEGPQIVRTWPYTIVSFTSQAILPVANLCIADCDTITVSSDGEAAPFRVIVVKGERAAVVATGNGMAQYTVCDRASSNCMRYTVLRAR